MSQLSMVVNLHLVLEVIFILRVMLRPHRQPSSRIAWIAIIAALPGLGIAAYILFGEVNIGRRKAERMQRVMAKLPRFAAEPAEQHQGTAQNVPVLYEQLFKLGESISNFPVVAGNAAELLPDSQATIDRLCADIDQATQHVHVLFYIWLTDNTGVRVIEALIRAAQRGVTCRVMADDLGSRGLINSAYWKQMQQAGVKTIAALPIGNPLLRIMFARIDLRNHRKIVVIDNDITYCGSQNCADPEFRVKPKFAPWVDAMMRFTGPVARQNQLLFATDWMTHTRETLKDLLQEPIPCDGPGFCAQVIGTGPTVRNSAMPELFETLIYFARQEVLITTPYYVPDESLQNAICSAAYRGVNVTLILPERNDSRIVAGASRSYYQELLQAGVQLYEYEPGLLHTKSLTVDGEICLIGSANMDRRSFDLNYENNILFHDPVLTSQMRQRQREYIDDSHLMTAAMVKQWSLPRRLWNNTMAMLSPIL